MKLVYFERTTKIGFHVHAGSYVKGIYIPDENVILFKDRLGTFGGTFYSISEGTEFIDEVKAVLKGEKPQGKGITYSDVKEFECSISLETMRQLVKDAKQTNKLRTKIGFGIDNLLEQATHQ